MRGIRSSFSHVSGDAELPSDSGTDETSLLGTHLQALH